MFMAGSIISVRSFALLSLKACPFPVSLIFIQGGETRMTSVLILTPLLLAADFDDLLALDLDEMSWSRLGSANDTRPRPRREHGFLADRGKLYVHGGRTGAPTGMYLCINGHW